MDKVFFSGEGRILRPLGLHSELMRELDDVLVDFGKGFSREYLLRFKCKVSERLMRVIESEVGFDG